MAGGADQETPIVKIRSYPEILEGQSFASPLEKEEYVVIHELGHKKYYLEGLSQNEEWQKALELDNISWSIDYFKLRELTEWENKKPWERSPIPPSEYVYSGPEGLSGYTTSNKDEFFADFCALYVTDSGKAEILKNNFPNIYNFVKENVFEGREYYYENGEIKIIQ